MDKSVLLSIIIPTRNRPETAIFAVRNALSLSPGDDIEVVVHDCGDNDDLQSLLQTLSDPRIKYYKVMATNMADNWNQAIDRAIGKYITVIGDDDAIKTGIMDIVKWASSHNIEVVANRKKAAYYWKNYPVQSMQGLGRIGKFSGKVAFYNAKKEFNKAIASARCSNYHRLPNLYHGIVSSVLLKTVKSTTGCYVDGTSPDYYSSFILAYFSSRYCVIDYPISFYGASLSSNSGRHAKDPKLTGEHLREYDRLKWPAALPNNRIYFYSVIAESLHRALENIGKKELFTQYPLHELYAICFVAKQDVKTYYELINKYWGLNVGLGGLLRLAFAILQETASRLLGKIKRFFIPDSALQIKEFYSENILDAVDFVDLYLRKNNLPLRLPEVPKPV